MMARRGPDDEGLWSDGAHCTFGYRRLAILDLAPTGHQPMLTDDRRFVLVFNGEVYNFRELRATLEQKGVVFRSSGDAEVVLYALAEWGGDALPRFNGMFALAFYDTLEKKLLLARDPAGIKPLYYLHNSQGLVFASQYDQIMVHPWSKDLPIDQGSAALYLRFGYVPAPNAILNNTYMLPAGSWLELDVSGRLRQGRYFDFPVYTEPDLYGSEAYEAVDIALVSAVRRQMVSDVPLGTFLSGGIDSPLVTAIAQELSPEPIKAFTIGVADSSLDESEDAIKYAGRSGVEHHLQMIKFDHVQDLAMDAISACSEPFGDYSIFPTLLAAKFASQHIKVMLSGDGGDELFWGYTGRMGSAIRFSEGFRTPFGLRKLRWWLLHQPEGWNLRYFNTAGQWYQSQHEHNFEGWLKELLPDIKPFPEAYHQYRYNGKQRDHTAQWVRWNEFTGHMCPGLLKVDRGSMYHSLEVRVPLLDLEVINTAARVDWRSCLDIEKDTGKLPLRKALDKRVGFQTSGKRGFTVPMAEWLRGPLQPLFEETMLSRKDLFGLPVETSALRRVYQEHLSGKMNREWGLWILLSAALWQDKYLCR